MLKMLQFLAHQKSRFEVAITGSASPLTWKALRPKDRGQQTGRRRRRRCVLLRSRGSRFVASQALAYFLKPIRLTAAAKVACENLTRANQFVILFLQNGLQKRFTAATALLDENLPQGKIGLEMRGIDCEEPAQQWLGSRGASEYPTSHEPVPTRRPARHPLRRPPARDWDAAAATTGCGCGAATRWLQAALATERLPHCGYRPNRPTTLRQPKDERSGETRRRPRRRAIVRSPCAIGEAGMGIQVIGQAMGRLPRPATGIGRARRRVEHGAKAFDEVRWRLGLGRGQLGERRPELVVQAMRVACDSPQGCRSRGGPRPFRGKPVGFVFISARKTKAKAFSRGQNQPMNFLRSSLPARRSDERAGCCSCRNIRSHVWRCQ